MNLSWGKGWCSEQNPKTGHITCHWYPQTHAEGVHAVWKEALVAPSCVGPQGVEEAASSQAKIGWWTLGCGKWSSTWRHAQQDHFELLDLSKSSHRLQTALIHLWDAAHNNDNNDSWINRFGCGLTDLDAIAVRGFIVVVAERENSNCRGTTGQQEVWSPERVNECRRAGGHTLLK